jgi:endonuclease III
MQDRERLIQEDHIRQSDGPWRVLVICQCLNLAAWMVAEQVVEELFEKWPRPEDLAEAEVEDVVDVVRRLGFGSRRAMSLKSMSLKSMSRSYADCEDRFGLRWREYPVMAFKGCGEYARDAWDLFVLMSPCEPSDVHLRRYAKRVGLLVSDREDGTTLSEVQDIKYNRLGGGTEE